MWLSPFHFMPCRTEIPFIHLLAGRWTHLYSATTVPVVPPRHDEYPRFLSAAWPYYTGAISTSVGFVLFCAMWLGGAGEEEKKRKKGKTE
jgi:oligosaccharyltransferase complex subunit beta